MYVWNERYPHRLTLFDSDGVATGAEAFASSVGSGFEGLVVCHWTSEVV